MLTFAPSQLASLLSVAEDPNEVRRWSLANLPAPAGYVAALAVEGSTSRIQLWQWPTTAVDPNKSKARNLGPGSVDVFTLGVGAFCNHA